MANQWMSECVSNNSRFCHIFGWNASEQYKIEIDAKDKNAIRNTHIKYNSYFINYAESLCAVDLKSQPQCVRMYVLRVFDRECIYICPVWIIFYELWPFLWITRSHTRARSFRSKCLKMKYRKRNREKNKRLAGSVLF